ncbi:hypothetical protein ACC676_39940, partial [Rhizobium ruizarguesonis]
DETGKSPFAGYTLGRMFLDGLITAEQRQACDDYAEAIARYHKTTGIPAPSPRARSAKVSVTSPSWPLTENSDCARG